MTLLSIKYEPLSGIFQHVNNKVKMDRIDSLELITAILISIDGSYS
jgi:hypothetical protein